MARGHLDSEGILFLFWWILLQILHSTGCRQAFVIAKHAVTNFQRIVAIGTTVKHGKKGSFPLWLREKILMSYLKL